MNAAPNFELFEEGQRNRHVKRLHVTLNKDGHFFLNAHALEALGFTPRKDAAGNASGAVALLFDRRLKMIGVMPCSLEKSHAYELRRKDSFGAARLVYAKNFCKAYGIRTAETIAFEGASVNRDGILCLDLNKVSSVQRSAFINQQSARI